MGISTRFVVMYGVFFPEWNEEWHNTLEEYYENTKQPEGKDHFDFFNKWAVMDYMSGKNFYIGKVLGKSEDMRWDSPDINTEIDLKDLPKIQEQYIIEFKEQFPQFSPLILHEEWKIHAFTHYS